MPQHQIPVSFIEATHALNDGYAIKLNGRVFFKLGRSIMVASKVSKHLAGAIGEQVTVPAEFVEVCTMNKEIIAKFDKIETFLPEDAEIFKLVDRDEAEAYDAAIKADPAYASRKEEALKKEVFGVDAYLKPA